MATRVTLHDASLHGVDETSTVDVSDDGNMGCCICFRLINEGEPYAVQANWLGGTWHVDCIERGRRALECMGRAQVYATLAVAKATQEAS